MTTSNPAAIANLANVPPICPLPMNPIVCVTGSILPDVLRRAGPRGQPGRKPCVVSLASFEKLERGDEPVLDRRSGRRGDLRDRDGGGDHREHDDESDCRTHVNSSVKSAALGRNLTR